MPTVTVPGLGTVTFPDSMTPNEIEDQLRRMHQSEGGPASHIIGGNVHAAADLGDTGPINSRRLMTADDQLVRDQLVYTSEEQAQQKAKRAEVDNIRRHGDIGNTDTSDELKTSAWNMFPSVEQQSPSQEFVRDTVMDRGFGPVIGVAERMGVVPVGTRDTVREAQMGARDRYLLAHPESMPVVGDLGRAVILSGGDAASGMAGPQALLAPGAGTLTGKAALAAGAEPGLARLAGFGGGAVEGAGITYLDDPNETTSVAERLKHMGIGGLLGGMGAAKSIEMPNESGTGRVDHAVAERRYQAQVDPREVQLGLRTPSLEAGNELAAASLPIASQAERRLQAAAEHGNPDAVPGIGSTVGDPPPRLGPEALKQYQSEREAVGTTIDSQVKSMAESDRQIVLPPEVVERMKTDQLKALDQSWHARAAHASTMTDDVVMHKLADDTEHAVMQAVEAPPVNRTPPPQQQQAGLTGINPEAGFIKLPQSTTPAPGSDPMSAVIAYDPTVTKEPLSVRLRKMADNWVDQMSDKQDAPIRILRRAGLKAESTLMERYTARVRGANRIANLPLFKGTYEFDPVTNNVTRTGDSLNAAVGGLDGQAYQDLNNYMAAQHHMELVNRKARAISQYRASAQPTIGSLASLHPGPVELHPDAMLNIDPRGTQLAQQTLADLHQRYGTTTDPATGRTVPNTLGDIAAKVRDTSTRAVVNGLDSIGWFKPGAKDAMLAAGQEYAPFFRLMDDLAHNPEFASGGTAAKPIKAISGGLSPDRPIAPPMESFITQIQRVLPWIEKQRVNNLMGDYAEAHPTELAAIQKVDPAAPGVVSTNTFPVYRDGEKVLYTGPADLIKSLSNTTPKQAGLLLQAGTLAARMLRAGAVLTPDFSTRSFLRREAMAGAYGAEYKYRPFADFLPGLFAQTPMGGKLREFAAQWEASGGALANLTDMDRPATAHTADSVAGLTDVGGRKYQVPGQVAKTLAEWQSEKNIFAKVAFPLLRPLEGLAHTVEQSTRIGAFRRAKLGGASDLDAGFFSRNVTQDFGRHGTLGQRWGAYDAFANDSLQGIARFSRAMKVTPVQTTVGALSSITLPALAAWYMHHDDPDYQAISEPEKMSFLHVHKFDDGTWLRVPRPKGILSTIFSYGPEKMLEAAQGAGLQEPVKDLLSNLFQETPLRYSPIQPSAQYGETFAGSMEAAPTALQPAFEVAAGPGGYSTHQQREIVPKPLQEDLPQDRSMDSSSTLAKKVGGALGVAPLKVDYLIRGYGAGLATQVEKGVEDVTGAGSDQPKLPLTKKDIPGIGGLVSPSSYGFGSQPVQDLYSLSSQASQAKKSLDLAAQQGKVFEYQRILREHPEITLADDLDEARKTLGELRAKRKEIRNMDGLTPENRVDQLLMIDQQVAQIAFGHMHYAADFLRGKR